jgi:hypothetical protein
MLRLELLFCDWRNIFRQKEKIISCMLLKKYNTVVLCNQLPSKTKLSLFQPR